MESNVLNDVYCWEVRTVVTVNGLTGCGLCVWECDSYFIALIFHIP
jgi:hypothetical protein